MKTERWEIPDLRIMYRETDPVGPMIVTLRHATAWAKRILAIACCWLFVVLCGPVTVTERNRPMRVNKFISIVLLVASCSLDSTSRLKGDSTDVEPADAGVDAAPSSWSAPLAAARVLRSRLP